MDFSQHEISDKTLHYSLPSLAATQSLSQRVAGLLEPHMVLFLQGDLGVGKTVFVKHLVKALACDDVVQSPSFPIMHSYATRLGEFLHLDLYRLDNGCDFYALGLTDKMDEVTWAIEWPEKGAYDWLSADICMQFGSTNGLHRVSLIAHSCRGENLLQLMSNRGSL